MNLACKEAARLVSEGLDRELPADERLRLHTHLAVCRGCKAIADRLGFLRRAMRRVVERGDPGKS